MLIGDMQPLSDWRQQVPIPKGRPKFIKMPRPYKRYTLVARDLQWVYDHPNESKAPSGGAQMLLDLYKKKLNKFLKVFRKYGFWEEEDNKVTRQIRFSVLLEKAKRLRKRPRHIAPSASPTS
jgi:hypothetical protein